VGGPDASAYAINQQGQVVGQSYTNSTPNSTTGIPTLDSFLWEKGRMTNLGTLGGTVGVTNWINNRGQVIGRSNLAGDQSYHGFFWDDGTLTDTGGLGGDYAVLVWINDAGDAVGGGLSSG
jgi:probable HAF family extracellular repeat protein